MHLTSEQKIKVRKFTEALAFGTVALAFYRYGPTWSLPRSWHFFFVGAVPLTLFVLYRASVCTLGRQFKFGQQIQTSSNPPTRHKQYQVPRRFGLLTLAFATSAIAVLAGLLRFAGASPAQTAAVLGLVCIVTCLQATMDQVPRSASVLAGTIYLTSITFVVDLFEPRMPPYFLLLGLVFGVAFGYVTGTLVAGLFLAADTLQSWWSESAAPTMKTQSRQSPWD